MTTLISNFDRTTYGANGFDSQTLIAPSTLEFLAAATKRGARGMRVTVSGNGNNAFVTKDGSFSLATGQTRYIGFWFNSITKTDATARMLSAANSASGKTAFVLQLRAAGGLRSSLIDDSDATHNGSTIGGDMEGTGWHWLVLEITASTGPGDNSGGMAIWIDGVRDSVLTGKDNDVIAAMTANLAIGLVDGPRDGTQFDVDDLVLGDSYPNPPGRPRMSMLGVGT